MSDFSYPEPYEKVGAEQLDLDRDVTKRGWMYKKAGSSKIPFTQLSNYDQRYFILVKGWVYYYKDKTSKSPQARFSLQGYSNRVVPAEEEMSSALPYVFKVFPKSPGQRTYYFAPDTEAEMNSWRECFKQEIDKYNITANNLRMSRSLPEKRIGVSPSSTPFHNVPGDTKRPNSFTNGSQAMTGRSIVANNSIASSHSTSTSDSIPSLIADDVDRRHEVFDPEDEYEKFATPADPAPNPPNFRSPRNSGDYPSEEYEEVMPNQEPPASRAQPQLPWRKSPAGRTSSIPTDQPPEPPVFQSPVATYKSPPASLDLNKIGISPRYPGGPAVPRRPTPTTGAPPKLPSRNHSGSSLPEYSTYEEPNAVSPVKSYNSPPPPVAKNYPLSPRTKPLPAVPIGSPTRPVAHQQEEIESENYQDSADVVSTQPLTPKFQSGFNSTSNLIITKFKNMPLPPTKAPIPDVGPKPKLPPAKPRSQTSNPQITTASSSDYPRRQLSPPHGASKSPLGKPPVKPDNLSKPASKPGTGPKPPTQSKPATPSKPRSHSKPVYCEQSGTSSSSSTVASKAKMFRGNAVVGGGAVKNTQNEASNSVSARTKMFENAKPPTGQKPQFNFNNRR